MSQRPGLLYNFLSHPFIYIIFQKLMSGTSYRKNLILKKVKNKKIKILDIGCGPAEILNYLPGCIYYGFDIDKRQIEYARKKYKGNKFYFFCKKFTENDIGKLPKFDYVILFGILHHLKNDEAKNILRLCKKVMKNHAVLLTEDPILIKNQNKIAKFLIENDRGMNVRTKSQYLELVKNYFKKTQSSVTKQFFVPYTWFSMFCSK